MATYYCVKRPGECDGTCSVCPISDPAQYEFEFMKTSPRTLRETFIDIMAQEEAYRKENARIEGRDDVNHPDHYTLGKIEVFDFIKAWELSFAEGNVVKYTVRAPYKGSKLKDLKKARWYLDQLISEAEKEAS